MMKGFSRYSEKWTIFSSLHMKRKKGDSKIEKYFNFLKMDKKNVQNGIAKIVLTDKKFCLDKEILSSHFKRQKNILLSYFFSKNLKIFSQWK